jgi:hypothetical protein
MPARERAQLERRCYETVGQALRSFPTGKRSPRSFPCPQFEIGKPTEDLGHACIEGSTAALDGIKDGLPLRIAW